MKVKLILFFSFAIVSVKISVSAITDFQNSQYIVGLPSRLRRQVSSSRNFRAADPSEADRPPIPRIDPPPPGSILTYDGQVISSNIRAFSITPKSEGRTPGINKSRPQFATYRGPLPPPIPEFVPKDLPQFKEQRAVAPNIRPTFE